MFNTKHVWGSLAEIKAQLATGAVTPQQVADSFWYTDDKELLKWGKNFKGSRIIQQSAKEVYWHRYTKLKFISSGIALMVSSLPLALVSLYLVTLLIPGICLLIFGTGKDD